MDFMNLGLDEPRAHRVDADAVWGKLFGHCQSEAVYRAFRCCVMRLVGHAAVARRNGRDVDDSSALPALLGRHKARGLARHKKAPQHIGLKHLGQVVLRRVHERARLPHNARVVDYRIQAAPSRLEGLKHGLHLALAGHIGLNGHSAAAGFLNLQGRVLCGFFVADEAEAHIKTLLGHGHTNGAPNAAAAAGN